MSYNGSGTFLINTAGQPVVSGTVISSTAFNALTADLATGLSTAITKDGQTTVTANIPMGTYKFTGLGAGTAATDSANLSQVQSTVTKLLASVSGADTITAVGSPTLGAYAAGQMFYFVAASANTGAVTINIDSLGAKSITRDGTTALAAGDIQSGEVCVIVYDGTQFQLVNGASQSASIVTENLTVNKATVLNESGGDNDTRIEGDTDANLFFADASTDRVGVGTNAPLAKFQVGNGTATTEIRIDADGGSGQGGFIRGYKDTSNASWYFGDLNPIAGGTNAGLCAYVYGTDPFVVYTNGSERLRLDSSGNLGLGVTPGTWGSTLRALQIGRDGAVSAGTTFSEIYLSGNARYDGSNWRYISTNPAAFYSVGETYHRWFIAGSGTAGNAITFTQAMTLDASGNLGVGTTSPTSIANYKTVTVNGTTGSLVDLASNGTVGARIQCDTSYPGMALFGLTNHPMVFGTNAAERARITSDGNLLVNSTSTTASKLIVVGSGTSSAAFAGLFADSNGANLLVVRNDGYIDTGTRAVSPYNNTTASAANMFVDSAGGLFRSTSSLKYKTGVQDATHGLSEVMQLRPVTYKGKTDGDTVFGGLIAEEVHAVGLTEFVQYAADGSPDALAYGNMVSLLVKAIQELKSELDAAKVKIAALEAK